MPDDAGSAVIRLMVQSDARSVRAALQSLFGTLEMACLPEADRGTAEIVLAEVLNNIVEHAQARKTGDIEVLLSHTPQGLACTVIDRGRRMPQGRMPKGLSADFSVAAGDPPEGGFGWHLIRLLATDLAYRRHGDRNELSFRLQTGQ
jgi:serine/threonine-protein kinase RsbW